MVRITSSLIVLSSVLAAFATPFTVAKRTVPQILNDITGLQNKTAALDAAIVGFNGDLFEALGIHDTAQALDTTLKAAVTTANSTGNFTEAEGISIIAAINTLKPFVIKSLEDIISKKALFVALPLGGVVDLVHSDITALSNDTAAWHDLLLKRYAAGQVANGTALKAEIIKAFDKAAAAYTS